MPTVRQRVASCADAVRGRCARSQVGVMNNTSFSEFKRGQIEKNLNDVKTRMKEMVNNAKGP